MHDRLAARFWRKVVKADGCWRWTAAKLSGGYGIIGSGEGKRNLLAHRASWLIHHGEIPGGMWVLHKCDNPECTNPDHLYLGTHVENMRDMAERGRGSNGRLRGERHGMAKLSDEFVLQIRAAAESGAYGNAIAAAYGVSRTMVCDIVKRKNWKHL